MGFFAYVSSTRVRASSSGKGDGSPFPSTIAIGATLTEVELLCVDIDTTHVGVNERGPKEDGNRELVRERTEPGTSCSEAVRPAGQPR